MAWRRHARSTTVRLGVAVFLSFLLGFVVLGGSVYAAVSALLYRDAREAILVDADGLADVYAKGGRNLLVSEVRDRIAEPDDANSVYALELDGRRIASNDSAATRAGRDGWRETRVRDAGGGTTRTLVERRTLAPGVVLSTGLRLRSESGFLDLMARMTLGALAIAVILGIAIGGTTARWVARRLQQLESTTTRVAGGDIALRAPVDGTGDAFDRLALRFNAMLDRIEALLAGVREATDHIAHDLRTPLTRLRTRLDQLRTQADAVSPEALDPAIAEADQLLQASSALLRLARIEAQARIEHEPAVDLAALAHDAIELYEPIAAQRGVSLMADTRPLRVHGDADQLFQLVVNLLDNAVKYAPAGTEVGVAVEQTGEHACLTITDHGEGIPAQERERVFDRFHRLDAHRGTPGTGLGLSLVRAIALRHRARIGLEDNHPGLRAIVSIPLASADPEQAPREHPPR
jgi:signal transduction histidine kinase